MQGIKNIIFDLGGVILNIDYKRPQEEEKIKSMGKNESRREEPIIRSS